MSTTTMHQSRLSKNHLTNDTSFAAYQSSTSRSNPRFKSTLHVVTAARDHPNNSSTRRRRTAQSATDLESSIPSSLNLNSYARHLQPQPQAQQTLASRTYHHNYPISLSVRTSSSSNRRFSYAETMAPSTSSYSSLLTLNNRQQTTNHPPPAASQSDDLKRCVSVIGKRCTTDSNIKPTNSIIEPQTLSTQTNQIILLPKSRSNSTLSQHTIDKYHHSSCPVAYQTQFSLGTTTILSDSSSDNTILHHLPDQNETTDKSQQSLHDERLHRSPRKHHNHQVGTSRGILHSTSSIEEHKQNKRPSLQYTIAPIEIEHQQQHSLMNDEEYNVDNLSVKLQQTIREEKKRKVEEDEQVVINVVEYASDILAYLKEREYISRPKPHYMRKQTELTWDMRAILIDWLSEVADEYKLYSETLHLAVNFIDRFLSRMSVTKSKFQLIGTTALYLAAKCEEVYPPNATEFAYVTDNAYTKKQVLKIEDLLLQTLHFEVSTVTTHTFLLHYFKLAQVDEKTADLARYIAELTLLDSECLQHLSSLQAAAILCLSLHMCQKPAWSNKLKQTTGYTIQSFYTIMEKIFWLVAKANVHDKWAITRKYRHVKHHCVASIELPNALPYIDMDDDAIM